MEMLEQPDEKKNFFLVLHSLKEENVLDYSWMRYEEGNLVDSIWLNPEQDAIQKAYHLAGRAPLKETLAHLERELTSRIHFVAGSRGDKGILHFLEGSREELKEKVRVPAFFTGDMETDENLLRFLTVLAQNEEPRLERVLSAELYGDSKYFEHTLKTRVLGILKKVAKDTEGERERTDEELLLAYGVSRWPEVYEFCGPVTILLDDGSRLDFRNARYGAYLNSETVRHIEKVQLAETERILFIENKANYVWAIQNIAQKEEKTLLIYHGGFFSPMKGRLFQLMIDAQKPGTKVDHWSDIDVGGFRIFERLKSTIAPMVRPYQMDIETLKKYGSRTMPVIDKQYLTTLERMSKDPTFEDFSPVIDYMLEKKVRLEQEAEIYGSWDH